VWGRGDNKILEIGVGSKVLKCLLENFSVSYTSLDIRPENKPDYIGSVTEMPFEDDSFDIVCCFQVLEHIPYEFFEKSLSELFRVARKVVLIFRKRILDVMVGV
jgi:SAM-dependent methyltransferase